MVLVVVGGVQAPFIDAVLSLPFNCFFCLEVFTSGQLQMKMFQAATVVTAFLICLNVLYIPCQMYHELFCNSFNSARIVTLLVFIIAGVLFF